MEWCSRTQLWTQQSCLAVWTLDLHLQIQTDLLKCTVRIVRLSHILRNMFERRFIWCWHVSWGQSVVSIHFYCESLLSTVKGTAWLGLLRQPERASVPIWQTRSLSSASASSNCIYIFNRMAGNLNLSRSWVPTLLWECKACFIVRNRVQICRNLWVALDRHILKFIFKFCWSLHIPVPFRLLN